MDPNVERLVIRCRDGERRAFELIVERFQRQVFYTILRVVRDSHLADDLTQEVFITVFKRIRELKDIGSFKPWLLRMAMNRAIDSRRKSKREQERVFLVEDFATVARGQRGESTTEVEAEKTADEARTRQLECELTAAIDALPEGQRKVLLMSMAQHMSQEDIGATLGIPKGTVKSRLHHARKFLTVRLRKVLEGA